jgi:Fe-S cluster assembly ATPase SufC
MPNYIHILEGGKIICSGGMETVRELEEKGYALLNQEEIP